jgi:quercetin dioxygenase-like cupin family protein
VLRWQGGAIPDAPAQEYKADDGSFEGVIRRLVAAPETGAFDVRYFELASGGYSSHEKHAHVHVVLCMRGTGRVTLGAESHALDPGDIVTVAPHTPHQFAAEGAGPFGFFCIVDRQRDRPVPVKGG